MMDGAATANEAEKAGAGGAAQTPAAAATVITLGPRPLPAPANEPLPAPANEPSAPGASATRRFLSRLWARRRVLFGIGWVNLSEFVDYLRMRVLVLGLTITVVLLLAVMLRPDVLALLPVHASDRHAGPFIDMHFAALIVFACLIPGFPSRLAFLLISRRWMAHKVRPRVPRGWGDDALAEKAEISWQYESLRAGWSMSRAQAFASLWGFLTTLTLASAIVFVIPPFHAPGTTFNQPHNFVAFAVIGTVGASFLLSFAQLCLRTSHDDTSRRTFAASIGNLLSCLITTLALTLASKLLGVDERIAKLEDGGSGVAPTLMFVGLGTGVAILGVPAFDAIRDRFAKVLGVAEAAPVNTTPLTALSGVTADEAARLGEEGLVSLESLVNAPVPRLFLNTRFPLPRICDWIDEGLLITRIGVAAAADLRTRCGVARASDVCAVLASEDAKLRDTLMGSLKDALRSRSTGEAALALHLIVGDERVRLLGVFRQTLIKARQADEAAASSTSLPAVPLRSTAAA